MKQALPFLILLACWGSAEPCHWLVSGRIEPL